MNFLAHLFLGKEREEWLVGNFLADYLNKAELETLPVGVRQGVQLHRQIDAFTDAHDAVRENVRMLHPQHHKYATVVVDILYDYYLARHFDLYSEVSLRDFTQQAYHILLAHLPVMPGRLQQRLPAMVAADWLFGYGQEAGMAETFRRLSQRVSRPDLLGDPLASRQQWDEELDQGFRAFFPDLVLVATTFAEEHKA